MSAIIRPRSTRFGQPTGPVEIDWSHPWTSTLTAYCLATNSGVVELVRNLQFQRVGGADVKSGLAGVRASTGANGDLWTLSGLADLLPSVSSSVTMLNVLQLDTVLATGTGIAQRAFRLFNQSAGSIFVNDAIYTTSVNAAVWQPAAQLSGGVFPNLQLRNESSSTLPVATNRLYSMAFARQTGVLNASAWRNSVGGNAVAQTPSTTTQTTSLVALPDSITIGASDVSSHRLAGGVFVVALFSEFASQEKLNALTANPWQLLKPIQHRIWFDMGGASAARTGQAHISHSHSTSASGKKGSAGSVAVSHASATAAAGTKAASATISISHTHALTVTGYKTEQETDARTGTAHIFHAADLFAAGYKATAGTAHITHMHSLMVVGVGPIVPIADDEIYMTARLDARDYTDHIQARDYTARLDARLDTVRM